MSFKNKYFFKPEFSVSLRFKVADVSVLCKKHIFFFFCECLPAYLKLQCSHVITSSCTKYFSHAHEHSESQQRRCNLMVLCVFWLDLLWLLTGNSLHLCLNCDSVMLYCVYLFTLLGSILICILGWMPNKTIETYETFLFRKQVVRYPHFLPYQWVTAS